MKRSYNENEIFQKIKEIISDKNGLDLFEIEKESLLTQDLGLDSLDEVELCIEIEREFDITIDDSYCAEWKNVQNVIDDVNKILKL